MAVDNGLDLSIALGRDDRGDAAILQVCEDSVGVVALVAGSGPGSAMTGA